MPTIEFADISDILYAQNGTPGESYFVVGGSVAPDHSVQIVTQEGQVYSGLNYTSPAGVWRTQINGYGSLPFHGLYEFTAVDTVTGERSAPTGILIASAVGETLAGPTLGETITGPTFLIGFPYRGGFVAGSNPGGENTFLAYSVSPDAAGDHASGAQVVVHGGYRSTLVMPVSLDGLTGHHLALSQIEGQSTLVLETADAQVRADQDITTLRFNDVTLTVQRDPLVDFLYYDTRYRDVATLDLNVRQHYDNYGWHEGRDPNAFFSTLGYQSAYADVHAAGTNPLNHYDSFGWHEGRDPSANFDTNLYLTFNPDVAKAGVDPLAHYLQFGIEEGRKISPVVASGLVQDGFDPLYYKLANPDVGFSGLDPLAHYQTYGQHEGRNPDAFFDTNWYRAHNPDVAAAGIDPLMHYEIYGWHEGRDPSSHFNTQAYLAANPDVAAAGIDPLNHFLQFGVAEGRSAQGDLF